MVDVSVMRDTTGRSCHSGNAGLAAIAITILLMLTLIGTSISRMSFFNAQRTVVNKQSLQTYYVAQAGIQEALATRLVPRSNYLNSGVVPGADPLFEESGHVYQDPVNQQRQVGIYRYIIVGGDPARKPNGSYYTPSEKNNDDIPYLIATDTMPDNSPFYIISNGTTCRGSGDETGVDVISGFETPTCTGDYETDQLTLVAEVNLEKDSGGNDTLDRVRVFKDSSAIRLPGSAFVPSYGWVNSNQNLNFSQMWAEFRQSAATNPTHRLRKIVAYNFMDNEIYLNQDVGANQTNITLNQQVPADAVLRLYFEGPIDYRSYFRYDLEDCQQSPSQCNIQIRNRNNGNLYGGNTMIPLLPSSTQIILLPPLDNTLANGTWYDITILGGNGNNTIRSYGGNGRQGDPYVISFQTQP